MEQPSGRKRKTEGRSAVNRIPEETVVHKDSRWDIPRKRALLTSDGADSTTSGSDIPESHADRPPEVEYSERLISRGFTSTPVPRYSGKSNWEQYREVFETIVRSNGWDDVTSVLQLLSHLDGDALNVALLVPESRRMVPGFLIKSLSDHYNTPGRLAEYKRQFQRAMIRRFLLLSVHSADIWDRILPWPT